MKPYYQDASVTIYHGDCREVTAWLAADVLVTDPPYGIAGGRIGSHYAGGPKLGQVKWDNLQARDAALALWGSRPYAVFGSPRRLLDAPSFVEAPIIWDKGESPGMGRIDWPFGVSYEMIFVSGDGWSGKRRTSVIRVPHSTSAATSVGHPTPKPNALMEQIISYAPEGVICDPFAGSGSTLFAAKSLGRKAIGIDVDERYCEIAARRCSQETLDLGTI